MAAGLGFKDFTTGEVLTAADVDGYLMQGVWVFASAAARDAAVTSPQEGNFAYLKDTNVTTYYTGSAWANLDTTGMTNPMTTTGDIIYSSSGSTPARLGIGSTGNVLTVAGGVPSWAAPAGGGKVLQVVSTTYSTETSVTGQTWTDSGLSLSITPSSASSKILVLGALMVYAERAGAGMAAQFRLDRSGTVVYDQGVVTFLSNSNPNPPTVDATGNFSPVTYLDSPATTSSRTYKVQFKAGASTITAKVQYDSAISTLTLLEIGA